MAGSQDEWRISGDDRAKHDIQFLQLKPVNGFITGAQARDFFMQSGLPTQVLGQIWTLADINSDGRMDKKEFSIAMHLIKKKLQGYELPKVLPLTLKIDPTPVIGSFTQPIVGGVPMSQPMGIGFPMTGGSGMSIGPLMQPQASLETATMTTGALGFGPVMASSAAGSFLPGGVPHVPLTTSIPLGAAPRSSAPIPGGSLWAVPQNVKLKYMQTFNANDRNKKGYLLGVEARAILMQSGLSHPVLAQIWTLSDIDRDGKLTCDEFCIAMHLIELARMGQALPATLPQELLPSRTIPGSITAQLPSAIVPGPPRDAFGDLLSSVGMPLPVPTAPPTQVVEEVVDEQVTFEDKRKENFDRGQAELERRRALLKEQQQKEDNERMEKERQEAEKRERQRQEAEMKRQAELQRQVEKQREREREIEEQRRKMLEQRETARRELERQRQMEWERQRKEQLMVEKQREYEQLGIMKSQMANLKNELETLEAKKTDLMVKISQVQKGITDFTTSIDGMRLTRDRTLADINLYEKQSMELSKKSSTLGNEKDILNIQAQTAQTALSESDRSIIQNANSKKASIQKLKKELEQLEKDTETRLREIDRDNAELKSLKDQLTKLEREKPHLQKQQKDVTPLQKKITHDIQQNQKSNKEHQDKFKTTTGPTSKPADNTETGWFDFSSSDAISSVASAGTSSVINWDAAFPGTSGSATFNNTSTAWNSSGTTAIGDGTLQKMKYRAMYDFPAGREDELSLVAGMEVWVLADFTPVPGMEDWYKGEHDGKIGWFPKAYVERLDEPSSDLFGGAFDSLVQSSSVQKQDAAQQDIFSSKISQASAISTVNTTSSAAVSTQNHISHEQLLAKAIYPWKARQETDLTFDKDDVILVKKQEDMRWYGELNGKSGWFPKAYVKLVGDAAESGLAADTATAKKENMSDISSFTTSPSDAQGEYYIAMYTYTSNEPADLNFNEGDMIYVTAATGDWWSGTITDQGKSGIFPANYVRKLEMQAEQKSSKKPEIARVIAPYVATGTGQLSLETGNLINVRQKSPRGWWEGELQVRGQKKKIGWFPANYVKLLGSSSARSTPEPSLAASLTGSLLATSHNGTAENGELGKKHPTAETVVALYSYTAQNDDELTFQKDAIITVISRDNPDWWSGQLNGQTGMFPSNYVVANPQSKS